MDFTRGLLIALARYDFQFYAVNRTGTILGYEIEKLFDSDLITSTGKNDRYQRLRDDSLGKYAGQLFRSDFFTAEIIFHEFLVSLDNGLDEIGMGIGYIGESTLATVVINAIDNITTVGPRQVGTAAFHSEGLLNTADQRFQLFSAGIDLIDNDYACHATIPGGLKELSSVHLDAGRGADHNHSRLSPW